MENASPEPKESQNLKEKKEVKDEKAATDEVKLKALKNDSKSPEEGPKNNNNNDE